MAEDVKGFTSPQQLVSADQLGVMAGELQRIGRDLETLADDADELKLEVQADVAKVADAVATAWAFVQEVDAQVRKTRKDPADVMRRFLGND